MEQLLAGPTAPDYKCGAGVLALTSFLYMYSFFNIRCLTMPLILWVSCKILWECGPLNVRVWLANSLNPLLPNQNCGRATLQPLAPFTEARRGFVHTAFIADAGCNEHVTQTHKHTQTNTHTHTHTHMASH